MKEGRGSEIRAKKAVKAPVVMKPFIRGAFSRSR